MAIRGAKMLEPSDNNALDSLVCEIVDDLDMIAGVIGLTGAEGRTT